MKYIIPLFITLILVIAMIKRRAVYENFISGASDGLNVLKSVIAPMIAIITASHMMRASGAMDMLLSVIAPVTDFFNIPSEILPLAVIRPLSGSGAMGVYADILKEYGVNSEIGKVASVMNASTETTFYCLCVYFAKTRVKNNLRAVPAALIGDLTGIIVSVWVVRLLG